MDALPPPRDAAKPWVRERPPLPGPWMLRPLLVLVPLKVAVPAMRALRMNSSSILRCQLQIHLCLRHLETPDAHFSLTPGRDSSPLAGSDAGQSCDQ